MEQIAAEGPDAVSLTGIARTMAMSPAATYRYLDNGDALLADVVVDAYDSRAPDRTIPAAAAPGGSKRDRSLCAVVPAVSLGVQLSQSGLRSCG